ncbi:hypothetical protein BDZ89DRAFT_958469 [Hymenopellis radicata]|nr:hypothetical protein BDZ89DRAFT_958469 [Hymenopellis radicata]
MFVGSSVVVLSLLGVAAGAVVAKRASHAKRLALPDYALTYAPYVYFYSGETYWASDITEHLEHTTPEINFAPVASTQTVESLDAISTDAYLTSNDNVEDDPAWLLSANNKPDSSGYSAAPATIIAVPKTVGTVDVFYFYFYSYNRGNKVLGIRFGNHVGDWEHTMVRFTDGVPQTVYLSAHSGGTSYTYDAIDKLNGRPKVYIATGTHANYATTGEQDYSLPFGLLHDTTDEGALWDVTKNFRGFYYDRSAFTSAGGADIGGAKQDAEGVSWLSWLGRWGDQQYPDSDDRQYGIFGQYHYVSGPTGPLAKNLNRTTVCGNDDCDIQTSTSFAAAKAVEGESDGVVYDEYADEFSAFKEDLIARNASYSV